MKIQDTLKITFDYDDRQFTSSLRDSSTIGEIGEALVGLLLSAGFHKDNVDELFGLENDEKE